MKYSTGKLVKSKEISGPYDVILLGFLLAISVSLMILNFWWSSLQEIQDKLYLSHSSELRILSQSIAKNADQASDGNIEAFKLLLQDRDKFSKRLNILIVGDPEVRLQASPLSIQSQELKLLNRTWTQVLNAVDTILGRKKPVLEMLEMADGIRELLPKLQMVYEEIVEFLTASEASNNQIVFAVRQSWLMERIGRSVDKLMDENSNTVKVIENLAENTRLFGVVLNGMLDGNQQLGILKVKSEAVRARLGEAKILFDLIENKTKVLATYSQQLADVRLAAIHIFTDSQLLLDVVSQLTDAYISHADNRLVGVLSGSILGVLVFVLMLILGIRIYITGKQRLLNVRLQQKENQMAVTRLQDELKGLANGNLTIRATKTSEITAPIAKSFNLAIDALRKLVQTINDTAFQVGSASSASEKIAEQVSRASEKQLESINEVSKSVNDMAESIESVSRNSSESSQVALQAVEYAQEGVQAVSKTIVSMDGIRERIQETAKRLKRLGESSQEIGDILTLITEIAEQTNVLALNAAIQAASAGEEGQGFAAVADQVQQLAERSSDAAKQIRVLVNTIQADTQEAVDSMEASTSQVVDGAQLAHAAGKVLSSIQEVSMHLANLTQEISDAASTQAITSTEIASTMGVIQDITNQTAGGSHHNAKAIRRLAQLARNLNNSVSGFKLSN